SRRRPHVNVNGGTLCCLGKSNGRVSPAVDILRQPISNIRRLGRMNRRYFLMGTAMAAAGAVTKGIASPNDTVRIACVGVRGQGNAHIKHYLKYPNVEIGAVCDIDESVLDQRLGEIEKESGKRPARYTDIR